MPRGRWCIVGRSRCRPSRVTWNGDPSDHFLLLVADARTNRQVLREHPDLFADLPRLRQSRVIAALDAGRHPGTGLVLVERERASAAGGEEGAGGETGARGEEGVGGTKG